MKNWYTLLFVLLITPALSWAQLGGFSDVPIEITSDGETRFEGGVAVAEDNVAITYDDISIFCDYAQYNPDTRDVLLRGQVRIYREEVVFSGERAVYNLETKTLRAADFSGHSEPFKFSADNVTSLGGNAFKVRGASLTTHDSASPDWRFKAKGVRIYPDDRIVLTNVTMNVGQVPVFWYPYLYQSLREDMAFTITPGYSNIWGAFLLTKYTFPITDNMSGALRLDLRSDRGVAVGFDSDFRFGKDDRSFGTFTSYYANDSNPNLNKTSLPREEIDADRYRVSLQSRLFITDDIYASIDFNALSDSLVMEDFFRGDFITDPQPDNVLSVTKWDENYTITALARAQVNSFQQTVERLPEVVVDFKRQKLFGSPIFYEGETGVASLKQQWGDTGSDIPGYDSLRFDTLHQILFPKTYGGWLSLTPRLGFRGTYYSDTGYIDEFLTDDEVPETARELVNGGSDSRLSFIGGLESSFKVWRNYDNVRSGFWGLDGLRHIFQPYFNFSYVSNSGVDPNQVLQFDRLIPSTEIPPIDMPQFVAIDAIDNWSILRLGFRNRLQTERNGSVFNWVEMDTWFDVNIDNPYDPTDFSNVINRLTFRPLPWFSLTNDFQLPLFDDGFTQFNTRAIFMVTDWLELDLGHRFLNDSDFFDDSNLVTFGGYLRVNENWGFSMYQQYEIEDSTLESQRYSVHRDLTSWVASFGAVIRDNGNDNSEYGLLLTFTLKDFPQLNLPVNLDPQLGGDQ